MEYIREMKLSGIGENLHKNPSRNDSVLANPSKDGEDILHLFSGLQNVSDTIEALQQGYGLDMRLFGYGIKIESGKVIAICDQYEENGNCC